MWVIMMHPALCLRLHFEAETRQTGTWWLHPSSHCIPSRRNCPCCALLFFHDQSLKALKVIDRFLSWVQVCNTWAEELGVRNWIKQVSVTLLQSVTCHLTLDTHESHFYTCSGQSRQSLISVEISWKFQNLVCPNHLRYIPQAENSCSAVIPVFLPTDDKDSAGDQVR